jgi:hypothetical protein
MSEETKQDVQEADVELSDKDLEQVAGGAGTTVAAQVPPAHKGTQAMIKFAGS